ncbi:PREDICTED: 60S ribosomal protein L28-like [Amphimedon queenslandica]|uniref:Large ribosomal subunit protein eL28 n=1 Tax=Amphimedon queenslandica TaxID=400682 RepID=A0A1X7TDK5_AMPQE|nr:PREDICTED: 60S ribosomal protein L28-like [Amphimedon queenslandica]|eukprot:XP_003390729.1 PREDICTED: 60S ribosomal protein L28-like [Amphimedon queenslandica]
MSSQLQWELIKKSSSFIVKDKKNKAAFSREPNNLRHWHCYKYNGLVNNQAVGVYPGQGNKGVVLVYKKKKNYTPAKSLARVNLPNKDPRKVYRSIRKTLGNMKYRRDLIDPAVRRASIILKRQQKPKTRFLKMIKEKTEKK